MISTLARISTLHAGISQHVMIFTCFFFLLGQEKRWEIFKILLPKKVLLLKLADFIFTASVLIVICND